MSQDKGGKEARAAKREEAALLKLWVGGVKDIRPVRLMIHLRTGSRRLPVQVGALLLLGLMLYGSSAHGRRSAQSVSKLKAIGVIGIPYNVGWEGEGIDEGPSALRRAGLIEQLGQVAKEVVDLGDVSVDLPPREDSNPKLLNPHQVVAVCRAVAARVRSACEQGYFPLMLGAEDSAIMGMVEGLRQGLSEPLGLIYLDAHGDFNTPDTTPSGLIGGMDVAILTGRGPDLLTNIFGHRPQLSEEQIAIFGARDLDPPEREMLEGSKVHLYTMDRVRKLGAERAMREAAEKLLRFCGRIYVHMDIDVLEPSEMKAIHMSAPDGLTLAECASALRAVRETGKLSGLGVMVFNARKDPDGTEAQKLSQLIVDSLGHGRRVTVGEGPPTRRVKTQVRI